MFVTLQIAILSVFKDNYFTHPIFFLSVLLIDDHPEHLLTFIRGHTTFENWEPPENLCSTCCVLPKVNFQYFGSSTFFPHLKTCFSLKSAICLGMPKLQVEQHTHVLNKTLLTLTHATVLFQA